MRGDLLGRTLDDAPTVGEPREPKSESSINARTSDVTVDFFFFLDFIFTTIHVLAMGSKCALLLAVWREGLLGFGDAGDVGDAGATSRAE